MKTSHTASRAERVQDALDAADGHVGDADSERRAAAYYAGPYLETLDIDLQIAIASGTDYQTEVSGTSVDTRQALARLHYEAATQHYLHAITVHYDGQLPSDLSEDLADGFDDRRPASGDDWARLTRDERQSDLERSAAVAAHIRDTFAKHAPEAFRERDSPTLDTDLSR